MTAEPTSAEVSPERAATRDAAREAIRTAMAAGRLRPSMTFDAVRFAVDADLPVWALRGAWQEADVSWMGAPDGDPSDHLASIDVPPDEDDRPLVRIASGNEGRAYDEALAALIEHDKNLFQRDGELLTIAREPRRTEGGPLCESRRSTADACPDCRAEKGNPCERDVRRGANILLRPGTPKLRTTNEAVLHLRAARMIRWQRWDARRGKGDAGGRGKWVESDVPAKLIRLIANQGDWPGVRPIRGIMENPYIAPGNRLVTQAGYDDETAYVLLPSCSIGRDPIPSAPPREQARAALRYLWTEIACDFPFRGLTEPDPEDVTREAQFRKAVECPDAFVAIAMLLTIFARPAIDGATLGALFEAAGQGSGKSLQIHTIATVATGRAAGLATFPVRDGRPNEEELEKVLSGYALAGARSVAFDNIKGVITGTTLEKYMTAAETVDARILGSTGQHTLPWSAVIMFSGNNATMSDDVADRVLRSRIESPREQPRKRPASTFRHPDLLAAIRANRGRLVRAVLVILRSYLAAKDAGLDVPDCGTQGSFEAWSRIVPGALAWAGGPNILHAIPEGGHGGDEEGEAHATLMRHWPDTWNGLKAAEIITILFKDERAMKGGDAPPDGLDEARAAVRTLTSTRDGHEPNKQAFGTCLYKLRQKPRDGLRIEVEYDRSAKVNRYVVRRTQ